SVPMQSSMHWKGRTGPLLVDVNAGGAGLVRCEEALDDGAGVAVLQGVRRGFFGAGVSPRLASGPVGFLGPAVPHHPPAVARRRRTRKLVWRGVVGVFIGGLQRAARPTNQVADIRPPLPPMISSRTPPDLDRSAIETGRGSRRDR